MSIVFNEVKEIAKQKPIKLGDRFEKIPCEILPTFCPGRSMLLLKLHN